MVPPELTNTIEKFIVYASIGMKHISPTFYVYHTNIFEADSIYKKTSPKCHFTHICLLCFRSGAPMTLLTAGALIDPQLPATASNVLTSSRFLYWFSCNDIHSGRV